MRLWRRRRIAAEERRVVQLPANGQALVCDQPLRIVSLTVGRESSAQVMYDDGGMRVDEGLGAFPIPAGRPLDVRMLAGDSLPSGMVWLGVATPRTPRFETVERQAS